MPNEIDPDVRKSLMSQFNFGDEIVDATADQIKSTIDERAPAHFEQEAEKEEYSSEEDYDDGLPPQKKRLTGDEIFEAHGDSPTVGDMLQEVIDYENPGEVQDDVRETLNQMHVDEDIIQDMLNN